MKVYQLHLYFENGMSNRVYHGIPDFDRFYKDKTKPTLFWMHLFLYKYLKLQPEKYKEVELPILKKHSKNCYDVESVGMDGMWCSSQRFKDFVEKKEIPLDFFPVKVEAKRRYLMMWRELPVISDYEVDVRRSGYYKKNSLSRVRPIEIVFRSDIVEYYNYKMFCNTTHNYIYVTDELKQNFVANDFKFSYGYGGKDKPFPITEKKLNIKELEKDLLFARQKERELYLTEARQQKLQDVDDYLEKVLIADGDEEVLEKFRKEMKGIWKKDFERYQKGLMKPDERITYW